MINCAMFKVSNVKCLSMFSVILCLLVALVRCLLHLHVFIHLRLASHLGMLDAPHEGHDVELNSKMVLVDPFQR
jgi:hypothetical protein